MYNLMVGVRFYLLNKEIRRKAVKLIAKRLPIIDKSR